VSLASQRNNLRLRSAREHNSWHGRPVKFRQAEIRVGLAPVSIGLDLETGGLRQGGEFSIRFLAADLQSPPRRGEAVTFSAKTYFISQVSETHAPGEYIATMSPGGAA
jgi:hypothetical protein